MSTINITDLCYANDEYSVVNCLKYQQERHESHVVLHWVLGTIGVLFGASIIVTCISIYQKNRKDRIDCEVVEIETPNTAYKI